ncbi:hypothetical protein MBM_01174 [Drepanopeziza brunnea f. sp. 'multigermtubi' MB_m1]|uniref:Uncharacterized protein n=1 Tax=Marssonina brunnea f. sp. multigermtubi (strain MB_m1) TaxID=1072389 RepID=K1X5T6_MARBU|nr:uncharacterized protein MBM_01174 [Drepanopeziza brunnea f. sp. 'multigermtubi' MB_m1]EKD20492.1 hypothetical protein MBM_01174 [Drepanopeziza brunnea f. sp. 'multigermtubi' MB_m1]
MITSVSLISKLLLSRVLLIGPEKCISLQSKLLIAIASPDPKVIAIVGTYTLTALLICICPGDPTSWYAELGGVGEGVKLGVLISPHRAIRAAALPFPPAKWSSISLAVMHGRRRWSTEDHIQDL